ncbi:hypothetical protein jhhlp_001140 [Lomentospora prolificans]|uniref:F-box domain-containing protein n=1 Tax=Lomentospora prolificans TaxID=41688 RepID=A0A2N3NHA2_9PEZI|nr:hypothetical protein jhhlp_001140 [Lomentospora prolificans]
MDPPHITEFASERYFSKLNQLGESPETSAVDNPSTQPQFIQSSTFILPLRSTKLPEGDVATVRPVDHKRSERGRLFGLRSKVSLLHAKAITPEPSSLFFTSKPTGDLSVPTRLPLDDLFRSLPNELQIQIINSLPLSDILNLRRSGIILTIKFRLMLFASILRQTHPRLTFIISADFGIGSITTKAQMQEFAPQQERMRRRLIPLLFTIFHFFEMYRKLHSERIAENGGHGLRHEPYTLNPIELKIMSMYDDKTLLRVHQVFPLVISSFCRQLRPPSYVGRVERSLRGYLREKPSDEVHAAILCLGGLRQVERFWEIGGYNSRRGAVDQWYSSLSATPDPPPKPKRSIINIGRKKSMAALRKEPTSQYASAPPMPMDTTPANAASFVFNTSLAAGMPMGPMSPDQAAQLLQDLPALQQIWLVTAEALILDRRIVQRPQDILRNAQVMLELIREDGLEEEDEWWYGRDAPDSLRPPAGVCENDHGDSIPTDTIIEHIR